MPKRQRTASCRTDIVTNVLKRSKKQSLHCSGSRLAVHKKKRSNSKNGLDSRLVQQTDRCTGETAVKNSLQGYAVATCGHGKAQKASHRQARADDRHRKEGE